MNGIIKKIIPRYIKDFIKRLIIKNKYKISLNKSIKVNLNTKLNKNIFIGNNTNIVNSSIGLGTYISKDCYIPDTKIGNYCSISSNVKTKLGLHPTDFVSTHPAFYSKKNQAGFKFVDKNLFNEHRYADNQNKYVVKVGNDVWIGYNVIIMDGVTIGDGAIIGTSALVTKDIEPYSINVGIPAKKIGYRFEKKYRDFLLDFKWWEKEYEWIKNNANLFKEIDDFYDKFNS